MVIFNFSFNRSEMELKCLLDTTIFRIYLALLPSKIVQERGMQTELSGWQRGTETFCSHWEQVSPCGNAPLSRSVAPLSPLAFLIWKEHCVSFMWWPHPNTMNWNNRSLYIHLTLKFVFLISSALLIQPELLCIVCPPPHTFWANKCSWMIAKLQCFLCYAKCTHKDSQEETSGGQRVYCVHGIHVVEPGFLIG